MKRADFRAWVRCGAVLAVLAFLLAGAGAAFAQEAPTPHKSPRIPVSREPLAGSQAPAIKSRDVEGPATIIDGEHLRIDDIDLRLFGVVPPQLSASFGPQARVALDQLTRGQNVHCHVRDRDHDGRFLATCTTVNSKADLALELLRRGLAVTARGSIEPTDLATPYATAEDTARGQKLGLWSVAVPPPAPLPVTAATPVKNENPNVPPLPSELKTEEKPAEKTVPVAVTATTEGESAEKTSDQSTDRTMASSLAEASPPSAADASFVPSGSESSNAQGFFARYQLLFTGLVMLMTAFGIMVVLAVQRQRDQRDEMRAIAAALRGELLAARAVCQARLKLWDETDDKSAAWPRIRATLYQAYVGRLGWLGAILARQIASIYGQAGDYAAYFNPGMPSGEPAALTAKRQALFRLVQHIEEVLPKLATIEQNGARPKGEPVARPRDFIVGPASVPAHSSAVSDATAHNAPGTLSLAPLWDAIRRFTLARPTPEVKQPVASEEPLADYTTLIEEEMARMSYGEEPPPAPPNVTKIRTRS